MMFEMINGDVILVTETDSEEYGGRHYTLEIRTNYCNDDKIITETLEWVKDHSYDNMKTFNSYKSVYIDKNNEFTNEKNIKKIVVDLFYDDFQKERDNISYEIINDELNNSPIKIIKFTIHNLNTEFGEYVGNNTRFDMYVGDDLNLADNEFTMFVLDEEYVDECIDEIQELIYEFNQENIREELPTSAHD